MHLSCTQIVIVIVKKLYLKFKLKLFDFPLQDRKQPDVCDKFFHDVPFEAHFASDIPELQSMTAMPGVDGFTMKVDALYKVCGATCASSRSCVTIKSTSHKLTDFEVVNFSLILKKCCFPG